MCLNVNFLFINNLQHMKTLRVYILHCKTLSDRDQNINNIVARLKNYTFENIKLGEIAIIAANDPQDIPVHIIQQVVDYSPIQDAGLAKFNQFTKNIHINQLSNTLKHMEVFQRIALNGAANELHLILEDDVLFSEDVCVMFDKLMKAYKKQPIVFLSIPSNDVGEITFNDTKSQLVPFMDAYIIDTETAKTVRDNFFPIKFVNVFHMNYVLTKCNIPVFSSSRNLFVNGSRYGLFASSLNPNNQLIFNKDYMTLLELVNKPELTASDDAEVRKTISYSPIAKSPDFLHLVGKYNSKKGKYNEAEKAYKEAYDIFMSKKCILNHESIMLKDYIRLFKHLQTISS